MPQPAGPPQSFALSDGQTTSKVHLHRHHQELHVYGVDPQVHSQAISAAQSAQAQAQAMRHEAQLQHDANEQAQEYASRVKSEAERHVLLVSSEAQQHLEVANQTISSLQARNRELENQHQQLSQHMDILQANMPQMMAQQELQADKSGTHAATLPRLIKQRTKMARMLKALAASVGETMNELRMLVSPKARVPQRNPFRRLHPKGPPRLESMMLCLLLCLVP